MYDDMNRLVSSNKTGQGFSYVYDRFGNRWQQNLTAGSGPNPSYSFDANNRITGSSMTYDAAGNVTNDGNHSYTYDAENRIVSVDGGATASYLYDASGLRVRKTSSAGTVDYLYDLADHVVTELSSAGGWNRGELYVAGRHVATYSGGNGGTTNFSHTDWLGTERVRSGVTGVACETITSLAYGDGQATSGSCGDPSPLHFTGKQRDSETGLDEFPARYYSSTQGRWLSPDWSPVPVAIPYADLHDPRTLNLYAYVGDDPTNHPDADGHQNGAGVPPQIPKSCPGHGPGDPCPDPPIPEGTERQELVKRKLSDVAQTKASTTIPFPIIPELPRLGRLVTVAAEAIGTTTVTVAATVLYLISPGSGGANNLNDTIQIPPSTSQQGAVNTSPIQTSRGTNVVPDPNAQGAHSVPKRDPATGRVTGYTTFDANGNATLRYRGEGKTHGGVSPPLVLEPKPGKGPGASVNRARPARPEEIPQ